MPDLSPVELKAFLPARDFELSKRFYQDLGFTLCWSNEGLALLHYGPCGGEHVHVSFLLQDHYEKEFAEHLQMHLLVKDVDAWWVHIQEQGIESKYEIHAEPPQDQPWKMRDLVLVDPSGVLWRISQRMN